MRLLVTRHGETVANTLLRLQGHADTLLTARGVEQASVVAHKLANVKLDVIYSSDLGRCKQTTKWIAKKHPDIPIVWTSALRELDVGSLLNKNPKTVDWNNLPQDVETLKRILCASQTY